MEREIVNIDVDGIDYNDYPDFCDAFISYAEWDDGTPLSDDELDKLNDDRELVYEEVIKKVF
jgi:hypothetical protein